MTISKRLRYEILRRDNYSCYYCGTRASAENPITIDHVIPRALGGPNSPENLAAACQDCNAGKSSTPPDSETVEEVSVDALMWAQARNQAREENLEHFHRWNIYLDAFEDEWTAYGSEDRAGVFHSEILPAGWRTTVGKFMDSGLELDELIEFIHITMNARLSARTDRFRYFCGCCNNRIRDIEQRALEIYEQMKVEGVINGA